MRAPGQELQRLHPIAESCAAPDQGLLFCLLILLRWMQAQIDWAQAQTAAAGTDPGSVGKAGGSAAHKAKDKGIKLYSKQPAMPRSWLDTSSPEPAGSSSSSQAYTPPLQTPSTQWLAHFAYQFAAGAR